MSTFKIDTEKVNDSVETLRKLLDECEEIYNKKIPESEVDKGSTHNELYDLCQEIKTTCQYLGELINNSILFLGKSSEMFDTSDRESADAISDSSPATDGSGLSTGGSNETSGNISQQSVDVQLYGQHTNYTCGSASGNMILNSIGVQCSEEDFWNYANSNGEGTYVYRVCQTLNHFIGSEKYRYVDTSRMDLSAYYQLIYSSLERGYPVEVVMRIPEGTAFGYGTNGHYAVISGVYQNSNGEYMAKINDPFSGNWFTNGHQGQQIEVKLSDIQQYNKNHSGYVICN